MSRCDLIKAMTYCEQAPGYTIYQHGLDVAYRYEDLWATLRGFGSMEWCFKGDTLERLRGLSERAIPPDEAHDYHVFHDCGKPYCLTTDQDGRRHFPGHAEMSAEIWSKLHPEDTRTAELMRLDMWCHTAKTAEERKTIAEHPLGPTLLLTAYSELHANAERLFGGFDSDSFKIKRKALDKILATFYSGNTLTTTGESNGP